jgi:hypothetical protein
MSKSLPHEITATPAEIADLEWACRDVCQWLNVKMRTGKYSVVSWWNWHIIFIGRGYNVHAIDDEIGRLESIDRRPSITKAAQEFKRPPLIGLWHKHHNQACFIP